MTFQGRNALSVYGYDYDFDVAIEEGANMITSVPEYLGAVTKKGKMMGKS